MLSPGALPWLTFLRIWVNGARHYPLTRPTGRVFFWAAIPGIGTGIQVD